MELISGINVKMPVFVAADLEKERTDSMPGSDQLELSILKQSKIYSRIHCRGG